MIHFPKFGSTFKNLPKEHYGLNGIKHRYNRELKENAKLASDARALGLPEFTAKPINPTDIQIFVNKEYYDSDGRVTKLLLNRRFEHDGSLVVFTDNPDGTFNIKTSTVQVKKRFFQKKLDENLHKMSIIATDLLVKNKLYMQGMELDDIKASYQKSFDVTELSEKDLR